MNELMNHLCPSIFSYPFLRLPYTLLHLALAQPHRPRFPRLVEQLLGEQVLELLLVLAHTVDPVLFY